MNYTSDDLGRLIKRLEKEASMPPDKFFMSKIAAGARAVLNSRLLDHQYRQEQLALLNSIRKSK